jgi:hypothetical protein
MHHAQVAQQRAAGTADAAELVRSQQHRWRTSGEAGEQGRYLNQSAAADDGVDESGEECSTQDEAQGQASA